MKKVILILAGTIFVSICQVTAQKYTAYEYWKMEQDPAYSSLHERQSRGDILSAEEQSALAAFEIRLKDYFEKMPDFEKSQYYRYRVKWSAKPEKAEKYPVMPETDVFAGERSMYTQYLVSSGIFGLLYGGAAIAVFGLEDNEGLSVGIPLLTAGASVLIPVLTLKDKYVPYNSLSLSIHGKTAGAIQGAAFAVLLTGDNIDEGKLIFALSTASSIGLGRLGYSLGKSKPWSEGRASLYSYYGILMPLEGLAIDAAFKAEDPRIYGATSLLFGAGGYLLADRIASSYDYTRGDITATGMLATMNGLLGFMILTDINEDSDEMPPAQILIPAAGALAGTFAGHLWLKNAKLTNQQGRNVATATAGGVAIGLGLTALFSPETTTPYYVVSYITGMTTYAFMVESYKKKNSASFLTNERIGRWNVNIMPQNIFLNKKIAESGLYSPGKKIDFLPAFSASITF